MSMMKDMWKQLKDWAWTTPSLAEELDLPVVTPDSQLEEAARAVQREELVNDFLELAISRYCSICDEFFKRPHSLLMHKRSKDHIRKEEEYGQTI